MHFDTTTTTITATTMERCWRYKWWWERESACVWERERERERKREKEKKWESQRVCEIKKESNETCVIFVWKKKREREENVSRCDRERERDTCVWFCFVYDVVVCTTSAREPERVIMRLLIMKWGKSQYLFLYHRLKLLTCCWFLPQ